MVIGLSNYQSMLNKKILLLMLIMYDCYCMLIKIYHSFFIGCRPIKYAVKIITIHYTYNI